MTFVGELAERLHEDDRTLTVSIPPVYDAGQTDDSGFWVYDYGAITPLVDAIRIMAYDYSVAESAPGPVAPLDWVRRVVAGTTEASGDPSKLFLGVPLYGRNWVTATSGECPESAPGVETVTNRVVDDLVARRGATPVYDAALGEWTFTYDAEFADATTSCIQSREVFYVDDDGVQQRIQLAVDAGMGGVALFALGYDDQEVWNNVAAVDANLRPDHHRRLNPFCTERPARSGRFGPCRMLGVKIHLVDGTYELFRQNFGRAAKEPDAGPFAATTGVLASTLMLLADGATHVAVASDHIIESFRNDLWPGYKTSAGMPPELLEQIPLMEESLAAMGVTVWAMVDPRGRRRPRRRGRDRRRRRAGRAGADRDAGQGPRPVRARHAASCSSTGASAS